ncbi:hypothetical protein [Wenzhouxiangella sediminis]|uniref:Uncharacterized protein n=1 Tax=Wenzhouxiangella sediminis TaxID=1792836 RepID=A0A3E1K5B2_9GAMM|nr:hypothetical protein [Wenzhouxiangella sediminis]RFF29223.1 hypothetical protein DZC52_14050 [Wenzhouxiangella sediminis]
MSYNLTPNTAFSSVLAPQAAGQGSTNTGHVDMTGFSSVTFVIVLEAVTAGGTVTLNVEQSDNASDWTALAGSVSTDDAGILALEVHRPMARYIRAVVNRADQDAETNGMIALRRLATDNPVEDSETTSAVLVSPEAA